jgi:glutamate dehydrogenase/leucine dehydrogenase
MTTVAVQGFGNVGYYFSKLAAEEGFKVVAVSDSRGGVYVEKGLDPRTTLDCKKKNGRLAGCYCSGSVCDIKYGREISNEQLLELPVDILVPAALENVINAQNMRNIRAKIIVEMANGPVTEEAYRFLTDKGVIIVPDILANSGGVIVSYLEWKQGVENKYWTEERVNKELEKIITKALEKIWKKKQDTGSDLKRAALATAISRMVNK